MNILAKVGEIIKSYLTGPDGVSYAPGRLMAFSAFGIGEASTIRSLVDLTTKHPSVFDWNMWFQGQAMWQVALAGVCTGFILGQAPSDPGGKWWGKDSAPPPAPWRKEDSHDT